MTEQPSNTLLFTRLLDAEYGRGPLRLVLIPTAAGKWDVELCAHLGRREVLVVDVDKNAALDVASHYRDSLVNSGSWQPA
jgi:hypothetical protein